MWYSRIKISQNTQSADFSIPKILTEAKRLVGLDSYSRVPNWQNANNYITSIILNPSIDVDKLGLEEEWEKEKQKIIDEYNLRNYPQLQQQAPARKTQLNLIDEIINEAIRIHEQSSQNTVSGGRIQSASSGWDFINKQIAQNNLLSPEAKDLLKRKFAQQAEYLYGQREKSFIQPGLNFDATKLKPADQQLAMRLFQTNNLKNLTLDQKEEFLNFKNQYSPAQQQSLLNQQALLRKEQRDVQSNEYSEFFTEIQNLTVESKDRVPALLDEINNSYLTQAQKNVLRIKLDNKNKELI